MLNFNAPLLSTRRLGNSGGEDLQGASLRMTPGKPKDSNTGEDIQPGDTPRPKLPPGWWHQPLDKDNECDHELDGGCEGDIDLDDVEDDIDDVDYSNEAFSDAIDAFSLSVAIDIVEKKEQREHETDHSLKLKLAESSDEMDQTCPDFIIERFLQDATALAASSTLKLNVSQISSSKRLCYPWNYTGTAEACVLRTHKLCGVKSPVNEQAQCSVKHEK
ncbi:hypothetical protein D8674_007974 [Pyrus ussuriensis x Pyrus communis]|uniref:Uncharacterized protein n=1 Tax=Pyrus ussuriensis x Pyrus communis TaxID=2448454 RepID=A0A5N5HRJ3_9ROSA|nr:hypothetical protein D8674_007974 [Pyrus ussuriensis x Pyrus communis]